MAYDDAYLKNAYLYINSYFCDFSDWDLCFLPHDKVSIEIKLKMGCEIA